MVENSDCALSGRRFSAKLFVVKLRYVVTIERESDGRFIASVPEVPGCHVYGRTRQQAVGRARRALQFYVDSLRSKGQKPPRQPLVAVEVEVAA
jgi:predicted RNase H-like HicB family nuclease